MMFVAQANWIVPSEFTGHAGVWKNSTDGSESQEAFALVYEAILGLSDEQGSERFQSGDWLDNDTEEGPSDTHNLTSTQSAAKLSAGAVDLNIGSLEARYPGSSMSRAMFDGKRSETGPMQSHDTHLQANATEAVVLRSGYPGQSAGPDGNVSPLPNSAGVLNKSQLSDWMDAHALSRSSHHCAMFCRLGMEAAGMNTADRPLSGDAGDYGPFLLKHGAQTVPEDSYVPQVGDVVVFNKTGQHPNGHIEMYDGHLWVSDFKQQTFSPYRDAMSTPPFTIYRLS
jgi:hypothetical protein